MSDDRVSVEIAAPADLLFDLVAEVTNTSDLSPEANRVEWLGEPGHPVAGARFRGRSRWRGFSWWRSAKILKADPGHEFVFQTEPGRGIYHDATTWRYSFEPTEQGTTVVTEGYTRQAPYWLRTMDRMLGRPKALRSGMHRTLAKLKQIAEQPDGS